MTRLKEKQELPKTTKLLKSQSFGETRKSNISLQVDGSMYTALMGSEQVSNYVCLSDIFRGRKKVNSWCGGVDIID